MIFIILNYIFPIIFFHNSYNVFYSYTMLILIYHFSSSDFIIMIYNHLIATVYKGNIIKNLIMDCQSYTKYRPNETTGGIFVSWRRKEELPTGA